MIDLDRHVVKVGGFSHFLSVEQTDRYLTQLHLDADGLVQRNTIGHSRAGQPLHLMSVGQGERHALVIGMPHPNEPTGTLAALRLVEVLIGDCELTAALGLTWHVLPCADPDGARLNEGWFSGPYTREHYATNMYRPPFAEQFEWTFHRDDLATPGLPPTPESHAVMSVMDALKPELVVTMHNSEASGLYCYLTDPHAEFAAHLEQVAISATLPIGIGEFEGAAEPLAPGVFRTAPSLAGASMLCSTDYAARYGALGITVEAPLWAVPESADPRPAGPSAASLVRELGRARAVLCEQYGQWISTITQELRLTEVAQSMLTGARPFDGDWLPGDSLDPGQLSVAALSALTSGVELECLRAAGSVVRVLHQSTGTRASHRLRAVQQEATSAIASWSAKASRPNVKFVGLAESVRAHVGITLAGASVISAD